MLILGVSKSARRIFILDEWEKDPLFTINFLGASLDGEIVLKINYRSKHSDILTLKKGLSVNMIDAKKALMVYHDRTGGCYKLGFDFDETLGIYRQKIYLRMKY